MNNRAETAASDSCRHCGAALTRPGSLPYCCERCYLSAHQSLTRQPAVSDGRKALGEALVAALDAREHETGLHSKRVACHTLVLARHFSADAEQLDQVYLGALLHDIGKIGIPDAILLKQGPLNEAEWRVMRTHPEIGHRILAGADLMAEAESLVLHHEERFDGTGYPSGLSGTAIPLWARLFAVIDALDAMTSDRSYRKGLSFDAARAEIVRESGAQFDPQAVRLFLAEETALRQMVAVKCEMPPV